VAEGYAAGFIKSGPTFRPTWAERDRDFWREYHCLLLSMVCLIEKHKLDSRHTTAELRRAGKKALVDKNSE